MGKDRRLWTEAENKALIKLVNVHGVKKWRVVSDELKKFGFLFPGLLSLVD